MSSKLNSLKYRFLNIAAAMSLSAGCIKSLDNVIKPRSQVVECHIFIHGTVGAGLSLISPYKVLKDKIDNSNFLQASNWLRNQDWYLSRQIALDLGMKEIAFQRWDAASCKMLAPLIIESFKNVLESTYKDSNTKFYTFGWSGNLSHKERIVAATQLYKKLSTLQKELEEQNLTPKFHLWCHSHGGNVGLLLAMVQKYLEDPQSKSNPKEILEVVKKLESLPEQHSLVIESLCLVATPIQKESEYCAFSKVFKKVINFYSTNDKIQVADYISSTQSRESRRIIKCFERLPEHTRLFQFEVLEKPRFSEKFQGPTHKEFWFAMKKESNPEFLKPLPTVAYLAPIPNYIELEQGGPCNVETRLIIQEQSDGIKLESENPFVTLPTISERALNSSKVFLNANLQIQEDQFEDLSGVEKIVMKIYNFANV